MRLMNTILRIRNKIFAKYIAPRMEETYSSNDADVKYLFFKGKSNKLVIIFSAYHDEGPRYDYISTLGFLNRKEVSRLYIKDDFGFQTGSYYLGNNGKYNVEKAVLSLIDMIKEKCGATKLIFVGSSKGGYAALNFGLRYEGSRIIVAAPQYLLGTYMSETAKKFRPALADIIGHEPAEEDIEYLNGRLKELILSDPHALSQMVYIHCSKGDGTFQNHVSHLMADLCTAQIRIKRDIQDYEGHDTLKYYFPEYLIKCVKEEV